MLNLASLGGGSSELGVHINGVQVLKATAFFISLFSFCFATPQLVVADSSQVFLLFIFLSFPSFPSFFFFSFFFIFCTTIVVFLPIQHTHLIILIVGMAPPTLSPWCWNQAQVQVMEVVVVVLLSLLPHVHDDANEEEVRLPPFLLCNKT